MTLSTARYLYRMNRSRDTIRFTRLRYLARDPQSLSRFYDDALGVGGLMEFQPTTATVDRYGAGLFHTAFLFPDRPALAATLVRLDSLGIRIEGASDHDVSEAIYLSDPEGNGIEMYCDRPESSWRFDDGRIQMGTRALDLDNLLEAAPAPLSEPPTDVRIGHVHLRALDVSEAERFWTCQVGLDLTLRYGDAASFLSAGGYHHHIGINRFAPWTPRSAGAPGLIAMEMIIGTAAADAGGADEGSRVELVTPEGIQVSVCRMSPTVLRSRAR